MERLRQDLETLHEPRARAVAVGDDHASSRTARSSCQPGRSSRSGISARVREISKPQGETKTNVGIGGAEVVPVEPGRVLASLSEERRATGHGDELGHPVATRREGLNPLDAGHAWPGGEPARAAIRSRSEATNRAPARSLVQLMGLDLVVPSYSRVRGGTAAGWPSRASSAGKTASNCHQGVMHGHSISLLILSSRSGKINRLRWPTLAKFEKVPRRQNAEEARPP